MPEIGKLKTVNQQPIRIIGVTQDTVRPAKIEIATIQFGGDPYDGPYVVDPMFESQTLHTLAKTMQNDVTVNPIEVSRTSNPAGGTTVYIGGLING